MSARVGELAVVVALGDEPAVVRLRGDVDAISAPTVGAMLTLLVDRGVTNLVLDLTELDFLDAAGLGVLATTSAELRDLGGELVLRSPSAMAQRLLDVTGLGGFVRTEVVPPDRRSLPTDLACTSAPDPRLVVDAALLLLVALVSRSVEGADGASVSLERHGRLSTVAASNTTVMLMDRHQYTTGEGPCLAAAAEGRWFHSESLVLERRWPSFIPLAMEEGIASILSAPLVVDGTPVGSLNVYSNTVGVFGGAQLDRALDLAAQGSTLLTGLAATSVDEDAVARIADGLRSRGTIAQAQGVLMAHGHLSADDAQALLIRSARTAGLSVLQRAAEVVASTQDELQLRRNRPDGG